MRSLSSDNLSERAFANSILVSGSYATSQALRLISNLILSRILAPEAFGLMLLTMVILQGFQLLSDIGTGPSIVKSTRSGERVFRDTAWTLQLIRGTVIALLTAAAAIPAALVYEEPQLAPLIAFISITSIIDSLCPVSRYMASRELRYLTVSLIELGSQAISMLATIWFALELRSAWALAIGATLGVSLKTIGVYLFLPNSESWFRLEKDAAKELISYGKWIFLSTALTFLSRHGDKLVLGALLSKANLGTYAIALFIIESIAGLAGKLMTQIVFPIFSKLARENPNKIKEAYYKSRKKLELLTMPVAGILITNGQLIIDVLYDDRYKLAGVMLQILGIRLVLTIITAPGSRVLMVIDKTHWLSIIQVAGLCSMFCLVLPLHHFWGALGVVWGASLSYLIYAPMTLFALKDSKIISVKHEFYFMLPLAGSLVIGYLANLLLLQLIQ